MQKKVLTHFDEKGQAKMVEVSQKESTLRQAIAKGEVIMLPQTFSLIAKGNMAKGDVLGVARVAGIMACKECSHLIPMAHPIAITGVNLEFNLKEPNIIEIEAKVKTLDRTGVEMEALTAVSIAALTIYDMCKAVDRAMEIQNICLVQKSGGKSGNFYREGENNGEDISGLR